MTTSYSNQQGSKSRQDPCQVQLQYPRTSGTYRRHDDVFVYELQLLLSGVLPILQNLSYKLQKRLSYVLPIDQSNQKWLKTFSSLSEGYTKSRNVTHSASNGTDQCLNGSPNLLTISRANPIDSGCCRLPTASVLSNNADKSRFDQF